TFSPSLNPATRPEGIDALVSGVDRYNPSNISVLEDYLYHQIRNGEYDCFANLAVLKLYAIQLDLYNPDVAINILPKALCAAPLPDFNLCVALLGQRTASVDEDTEDHLPGAPPRAAATLVAAAALPLPGVLGGVRGRRTRSAARLHRPVHRLRGRCARGRRARRARDRLASYFNLQGEELDAYIAKLGWTQDNGVVSVPANPDNTIQASVVRENIQFN
ncbi:ARM repeat-containing protein, partial [Auricularia subglabra TFB-10046 SS5]